ncbi:MAG: L-seryl-tRNA(Sec) selenium transferase [Myxococcota bacterium]
MDAPEPVNAQLRQLPGVDRLIEAAARGNRHQPWSLRQAAREAVEAVRQDLLASGTDATAPDLDELVRRTRVRAESLERPIPRRVLNATGVVLHTNLGRAPMPREAADAIAGAARGYSDLEFDLDLGERGSRTERLSLLLALLSGAEAAHVVNNNAAALLLVVDTLAAGREVVLSRSELVEIGGSFRVPEIMEASRAQLREVGTTNRTHLADYERAVGPETGILLKVHPSNFEIRGFTSEVTLRELVPLGRAHDIPVVEDRGSGTFVDLQSYGIPEREAHAGLREGADLVLFSGDKLLGGPQAGIVLGKRELVTRLKRSPLARALRVDKLTIAALHWTLQSLLGGRASEELPVLKMILRPEAELRARAEQLAAGIDAAGFKVSVEPIPSRVGGGALPDVELAGVGVRIEPRGSVDALSRELRHSEPPVLGRVQRGGLLLDPRTLEDEEIEEVVGVFAALGAAHTPTQARGSR